MSIGNTVKNSLIAGGVAAVINAIIFFVSKSAGWISDDFVSENGPISLIPVLFSSIVLCLIGGILYWLLTSYVPYGGYIFWIIAIVVLFFSYFNAVKMIPNVPMSMQIALNVMHNVVASSLLYFLTAKKESAFA
jgi:hypothetical protein